MQALATADPKKFFGIRADALTGRVRGWAAGLLTKRRVSGRAGEAANGADRCT